MRSLSRRPIADPDNSSTKATLNARHPSPPTPVTPLDPTELPLPTEIDETDVLHAFRKMNPNSTAGPDLMSPRLLRLLTGTSITPEAGVTGLSFLTYLVQRIAYGDLPTPTVRLLAAAALIPIQQRPDKIRPIAVGQTLGQLVTKVLLTLAMADSAEYLQPEQVSTGTPCGVDAIVHDACMCHGLN